MARKSKRKKKVIGIVESIKIKGTNCEKEVLAKIDTGSSRTTIDTSLAAEVGLGPITDTVKIRAPSSQSKETRPLVNAKLTISDEEFELSVGITDREEMKYRAIVGMDILREGKFLIDVTKRADEEKDEE